MAGRGLSCWTSLASTTATWSSTNGGHAEPLRSGLPRPELEWVEVDDQWRMVAQAEERDDVGKRARPNQALSQVWVTEHVVQHIRPVALSEPRLGLLLLQMRGSFDPAIASLG